MCNCITTPKCPDCLKAKDQFTKCPKDVNLNVSYTTELEANINCDDPEYNIEHVGVFQNVFLNGNMITYTIPDCIEEGFYPIEWSVCCGDYISYGTLTVCVISDCTPDPCILISCQDNQYCLDGVCYCNDESSCNFNEPFLCSYSGDCIDCEGNSICPPGTICNNLGDCVEDITCDNYIADEILFKCEENGYSVNNICFDGPTPDEPVIISINDIEISTTIQFSNNFSFCLVAEGIYPLTDGEIFINNCSTGYTQIFEECINVCEDENACNTNLEEVCKYNYCAQTEQGTSEGFHFILNEFNGETTNLPVQDLVGSDFQNINNYLNSLNYNGNFSAGPKCEIGDSEPCAKRGFGVCYTTEDFNSLPSDLILTIEQPGFGANITENIVFNMNPVCSNECDCFNQNAYNVINIDDNQIEFTINIPNCNFTIGQTIIDSVVFSNICNTTSITRNGEFTVTEINGENISFSVANTQIDSSGFTCFKFVNTVC